MIEPGELADCCSNLGTVLVSTYLEGQDVLFCGHHYRKHEVKLKIDGFTVIHSTDDWSKE